MLDSISDRLSFQCFHLFCSSQSVTTLDLMLKHNHLFYTCIDSNNSKKQSIIIHVKHKLDFVENAHIKTFHQITLITMQRQTLPHNVTFCVLFMGGGSGRSQRRREREEGFAVFLPPCLCLVYLCICVFVDLYLCVVYGGGVKEVTTQGEE